MNQNWNANANGNQNANANRNQNQSFSQNRFVNQMQSIQENQNTRQLVFNEDSIVDFNKKKLLSDFVELRNAKRTI